MPTIEENHRKWNDTYHWSGGGNNWSAPWGTPDMQWQASIRPRIQRFLPTGTVLELGCGFGRWTHFLKDHCRRLYAIDLSERCVAQCRDRFRSEQHLSFFANDGKSLAMVPDGEIDFAFSFDSLVHAEADVLESYLAQLAMKLAPEGVAFIHHSNMRSYAAYSKTLRTVPPLRVLLRVLGFETKTHGRALTVDAGVVRDSAERVGLACASQELVNWRSSLLVDCLSVVARKGSTWAQPRGVLKNRRFMAEAANIARLSDLYAPDRQAA